MTPDFVAAVLEGFEGTLDIVLERLGEGDLKQDVEELRARIASKRQQFEAADTSAEPVSGR